MTVFCNLLHSKDCWIFWYIHGPFNVCTNFSQLYKEVTVHLNFRLWHLIKKYSYKDGLFLLTCKTLRSIIKSLQLLRVPLPISSFPSGGKVEGKWQVEGRMSELSFHSTLFIYTWLWEMKSWWAALPWHRGLSAGKHIFSMAHFRPLVQSRG